jgi:hypothetical protein
VAYRGELTHSPQLVFNIQGTSTLHSFFVCAVRRIKNVSEEATLRGTHETERDPADAASKVPLVFPPFVLAASAFLQYIRFYAAYKVFKYMCTVYW